MWTWGHTRYSSQDEATAILTRRSVHGAIPITELAALACRAFERNECVVTLQFVRKIEPRGRCRVDDLRTQQQIGM